MAKARSKKPAKGKKKSTLKAKKKSASKRKSLASKRSKAKAASKAKKSSHPKKKAAAKKKSVSKAKSSPRKAKPKKKTKRKPNASFMKPLTPSAALAKVVGSKPLPRTKVVKKLWDYIKKNQLQDSINRRNINADANLRAVFGKGTVSMFEMTKIVSQHLK